MVAICTGIFSTVTNKLTPHSHEDCISPLNFSFFRSNRSSFWNRAVAVTIQGRSLSGLMFMKSGGIASVLHS